MKKMRVCGTVCLFIFSLFVAHAQAENILNSDSNYDIKIAVRINEDNQIMGKLEYSNEAPLYPLQLVTYNPIGGLIYTEPYLFVIDERIIWSNNVHRIKCRCINDKYGAGALIVGTIDFRDELNPKVHLVNEGGHIYIDNITEKRTETQKKYIPNVWLGQ